jgi:AcrR family transcriptional regulator
MARPADPHSRSALLAAARVEFQRTGIQKTRIEDVTLACGLSKGAFYLHFDSKEALFREVVTAFEGEFEKVRRSREAAYAELIQDGLLTRRKNHALVSRLEEADRREDRKLLEVMWEWRDVTDVLLRGSQGTEFDGVLWEMLDREVARVEVECQALKAAMLIRDDVPADVVGMMIVGTYLLVARRLSRLSEKPDFDPWVKSLQTLISEGTSSDLLLNKRRSRVPTPRSRRKKI